MRLYLDANTIIYGIECVEPFHRTVIARTLAAESENEGVLITSLLSRIECRTKPTRDRNTKLLAKYDEFFARRRLLLNDLSAPIIDLATDLRARYNFKTPDAIHIATALCANADLVLTGDAALTRCKELKFEVLREG